MWAPQPSARAPKPLSWQADCSTADIGALECSKMLAALDRAAAAFSAALVFRRPVAIKISAIAAGAEPPAKRADAVGAGGPAPDTLASTAAPQHQLPARIGSSLVSYPQALAKQLTVLQASEMSAFDALILIQWPAGGFFFEGDVASAASLNSPNFGRYLSKYLVKGFGC